MPIFTSINVYRIFIELHRCLCFISRPECNLKEAKKETDQMRNRVIKLIFPAIAILLLAPWPVAYAYSYDGGLSASGEVRIEAAASSAAPSARVFGHAVGSIIPGDLFYIDSTGSPADFTATLHITNADELIHHYRYMILRVGAYAENGAGEWVEVTEYDGQPLPETYITLRNVIVELNLHGYGRYKIAIDSGNYRCTAINADGGSTSPRFYLTTN